MSKTMSKEEARNWLRAFGAIEVRKGRAICERLCQADG